VDAIFLIGMLHLYHGLLKLGLHDQQLLERWWITGIVVPKTIGIANPVVCHQNSRGDEKDNPISIGREKIGGYPN
jgi:hypothetical protein